MLVMKWVNNSLQPVMAKTRAEIQKALKKKKKKAKEGSAYLNN